MKRKRNKDNEKNMKSIRRKILTVELFELVELGGIDLKVFILIKNAERAVTAKELEEVLGLLPGFSTDSLRHLTERYFIERTRNGRYRVLTFPYDGARRPTGKGQRSRVESQEPRVMVTGYKNGRKTGTR